MFVAKDVMTANPLAFSPTTEVTVAARMLLEKRINGAPVVDPQQHVIGVLCQSDLVAQQKQIRLPSFYTLLDGIFPLGAQDELDKEMQKITALTVGEAMTKDPRTVTPDTPLDELATLMAENKLYTLPVVENGVLVGVVGKEDVLRAAFGTGK